MQDGMKGNPEESLRRALAEFAAETGSGAASDRVRQSLQHEVRRRAYRRWALAGFVAALATAAALSAILFGVTRRPAATLVPAPTQTAAGRTPAPNDLTVPAVAAVDSTTAGPPLAAGTKQVRRSRKQQASGDWRKGEIVLSPWYYNTALPASARSVLVRSEVDARTAMRFGVVPAGNTAPVEILFGEDGLPRAMRFVRHLPTQTN